MKSLLVTLAGLALCWHSTELGSEQTLPRLLAPQSVLFFTIALMIWLILKSGFGTQIRKGSDLLMPVLATAVATY